MLQVYQSNKLEALVTLLAEQLKHPLSANPFEAETILVQSPGMSQWLKLEIAKLNHIAANIEFPLPSSFIWSLYKTFLDDVPEDSPYNKDRLAWRIFQLLPSKLDLPEFEQLKAYLTKVKPVSGSLNSETEKLTVYQYSHQQDHQQQRLFQLAEKVADVFDNYLMYRQHWLTFWLEGNNDLPEDGFNDQILGQQWQAILWRDLVAEIDRDIQQQDKSLLASRAQMSDALLSKLQAANTESNKAAIAKLLPKRLSVFGISSLPDQQLQILRALGEFIEVDIYWLNPCAVFWGDILSDKSQARMQAKNEKFAELYANNVTDKERYFVSGNPLLASWGAVGKDYLTNLINNEIELHDLFIEPSAQTVLEQVQNDILTLQYRGSQTPLTPQQLMTPQGKKVISKTDDSLLVHNCHSRIRELEVLKDKLLQWFEQDPSLRAKDILVMVPDIDQYAPYITSVFGRHASESHSYIPYTVADRAGLREDPLLNTFVQLLTLPASRFTVNELVDWLEIPTLMNKFDLSVSELNLLKIWLQDCHVNWGKDKEHKKQWGLPASELNSWIYGLERMLLGMTLSGEKLWHNILSYRHIEGLQAVTLGKLLNYFSFVVELTESLRAQRDLVQWQSHIDVLIDYLFNAESVGVDEHLTIQKLKQANLKLSDYFTNDQINQPVSYRIINQYFKDQLNQTGVTQRFLAGSVNFCTLMPMRSVPFKVVCVLGLNEGDFPRQVDPISFDLVGLNKPRKGDRNRKADDRYLFLEALLSARDKLHLSYVGQSSKTNDQLMSSLVLSELIDYCDQSFLLETDTLAPNQTLSAKDVEGVENAKVCDHLILQHKLQPYSAEYFLPENADVRYVNKSALWYQIANLQSQPASDDADQPQTINEASQNLQPEHTTQTQVVELDELLRFFVHPIKYYFKQQLNTSLELYSDKLQDTETFQLDGLGRYKLVDELLTKRLYLQRNKQENYQDALNSQLYLRSGGLPEKAWGKSVLAKINDDIGFIGDVLDQILPAQLQLNLQELNAHVEQGHEIQVVANINGFNQQALFHHFEARAGECRVQDQLVLYLTHLVKSASYKSGYSIFIDHKGKLFWFEPMQVEEAKARLDNWLSIFNQHKDQLLLWHVNLAVKHCIAVQKQQNDLQRNQSLAEELTVSQFRRNLATDEYVSKVITDVNVLGEEFAQISELLMLPMLEDLQSQSGKKLPDFAFEDGGPR